jgi:hypothetical protein
MTASDKAFLRPAIGLVGMMFLSACTSAQTTASISPATTTVKPAPVSKKQVYHYTPADRDCMKRAMYFESQRSSREGLMAVGTVIMNRLTSDAYPSTICGIVAQERQFAPGVMTRPINEATVPELDAAVDAIIRGERRPGSQGRHVLSHGRLTFSLPEHALCHGCRRQCVLREARQGRGSADATAEARR